MKLPGLFSLLILAASSVFAGTPSFYSQLPAAPAGVNPATYPLPRQEWLERVKTNFETAAPQKQAVQLVFDGDSITDWWQKAGRSIWNERFGNLHAIDFGIAGDRTEQVLWRLSQGQVDGMTPILVAIMIGTNNLGPNSDEQIAQGIQAVVAEYQKRCPNAVILLQGIFPRGAEPTNPARARIKAINERISKLGDGKKVIFLDFGDKFLGPDGSLSKEIMPDALHPSAQGYAIWADAIAPVIQQFFPEAVTATNVPQK